MKGNFNDYSRGDTCMHCLRDIKKKTCTGPCGEEKDINEFHIHNGMRRHAKCIECSKEEKRLARLKHKKPRVRTVEKTDKDLVNKLTMMRW